MKTSVAFVVGGKEPGVWGGRKEGMLGKKQGQGKEGERLSDERD